jgi:NarL family two-component system response regulator LiaR
VEVQPLRLGTPCTVVLVDDRDDIRRLLAMLLDDEPDFVVVAEGRNGREAIELAQELTPDLLVIDNDMPVMSGLEAIPHVVAAVPTKVVMFSADADDLRARALDLGAAAAITKATGVLTFVEELRRVIGGSCGQDVRGGSAASALPWRT